VKLLGVEITESRAEWLQAIETHVERQFCRHLTAREKGEVFLCGLQHLAGADAVPVKKPQRLRPGHHLWHIGGRCLVERC